MESPLPTSLPKQTFTNKNAVTYITAKNQILHL